MLGSLRHVPAGIVRTQRLALCGALVMAGCGSPPVGDGSVVEVSDLRALEQAARLEDAAVWYDSEPGGSGPRRDTGFP